MRIKVTVCLPVCWGHGGEQKTVLGLQEPTSLDLRQMSHGQVQHGVISPTEGRGKEKPPAPPGRYI